jgi:hypothetical protein
MTGMPVIAFDVQFRSEDEAVLFERVFACAPDRDHVPAPMDERTHYETPPRRCRSLAARYENRYAIGINHLIRYVG